MLVTGTADIPDAIGRRYIRRVLYQTQPWLIFYLFAQKTDFTTGAGDTVKWRRILDLDSTERTIAEAITPPGQTLRKSDVLMVVQWYGDFVLHSDKVKYETSDPIMKISQRVLGDQAGKILDKVIRNAIIAGTNVMYIADDSGTEGAATANVAGRVSNTALDRAIREMRQNHFRPWKRSIRASAKEGTHPVRDSWPMIVDAEILFDMEQRIVGYKDQSEYPTDQRLHASEQGVYKNLRLFLTGQGYVDEGAGAALPAGIETDATGTNCNVHYGLIVSQDAYGAVRLGGEDAPFELIIHPLGSAGSADPLNQRGSVAWKAPQGAKILDDLGILRLEVAVSA